MEDPEESRMTLGGARTSTSWEGGGSSGPSGRQREEVSGRGRRREGPKADTKGGGGLVA